MRWFLYATIYIMGEGNINSDMSCRTYVLIFPRYLFFVLHVIKLLSIFINLMISYYIWFYIIFILIISLSSFHNRGLLGDTKVWFYILLLPMWPLHRIHLATFYHTYFISSKLEMSVVWKALDSLSQGKIETWSLDLSI